jgi:glutaredoxin 2
LTKWLQKVILYLTKVRFRIKEAAKMYLVRFVRQDTQPEEEYFYHKRSAAMEHFHLFRNDDSGLYNRIEVLELMERHSDPEQLIDRLQF